MSDPETATRLFAEIGSGDRAASEELLPLVYDELRRLVRARMARLRREKTVLRLGLHLPGSEDAYEFDDAAAFGAGGGGSFNVGVPGGGDR